MIHPSRLEEALRRGPEVAKAVEVFRAADRRRRELMRSLDELRAERNAASQRMAAADKRSAAFARERDALRALSQRVKGGEAELSRLDAAWEEALLAIPNAPHSSVPDGADASTNQVVSHWGQRPSLPRPFVAHWDLGPALGILDFEAGAKIAGARFCVLRDGGAQLTRALINFMIDLHLEAGYAEVWPPVLVRRQSLVGTGQLPKFEQDLFRVSGDSDLYLSPTAEVQVTNLHRETILEAEMLPLKYVAYAPCFRAEAGSYGKDTRGMIRQHQFDKVELVQFCEPEHSYDQLEALRADVERVLQALGLHYRVVTLAAGDLGFAAAKTYDVEVWLPGQDAYREISSVSNFADFQARRARIRYRPGPGEKPRSVHTLNGSGLAIGRTIVAILEQCQQPDGSVIIPGALRRYMGGRERLGPTP